MSSSCLQLNYCCCGCSLRTGVLIIAWLSILGSLFSFKPVDQDLISFNDQIKLFFMTVINIAINVLLLFGVYKKRGGFMVPYLVVVSLETLYTSILLAMNLCSEYEYRKAMDKVEDLHDQGRITYDNDKILKSNYQDKASLNNAIYGIIIPIYLYFLLVVWSYYNVLKKGDAAPGQNVIIVQMPSKNGTSPALPHVMNDVDAKLAYNPSFTYCQVVGDGKTAVPPPYPDAPPPYPGAMGPLYTEKKREMNLTISA